MPSMPYLQRSGKPTLFYELDDFTDPWAKAPVLLLQHGYGRNSSYWYQWVPYLSRFYRVVRPDLRGLGRSGKDFDLRKGLTVDAYLEDLVAIADDLGVETLHYCGESIGGILGMALAGAEAVRMRARVRSLSIVSAPVFISEKARKLLACGHESWPAAIHKMGPQGWLSATNASSRFPADMPQPFIDWYDKGVASAGADMLAAMAEFAMGANVTPYLPRIEAPMLCLYPEGGKVADDEQKALIRNNVRNVRMLTLPTPHHMLQYVRPALCAREVLHFVAAVDNRVCEEA
jgi:3-oxoadipate enol-lactonase